MKRLLIIVLTLVSVTVWAQDTVRSGNPASDSPALGDEPRQTVHKESNVLGAPVYYDINGNVRGTANPTPFYKRPKHHYLNNLDNRFCSFFFEGKTLIGSDYAVGPNFSYVPKRWGAYGTVLFGFEHDYLSVGPVLRLSDYDSRIDWQLYCGLMLGGRSAGAEAGLRMAVPQHNSEFCWTSASAGVAIVGGKPFFTLGCSLDLLVIGAATSFLLVW